ALSLKNALRVLKSLVTFGPKITFRRVANRLRARRQLPFDTGFVLSETVARHQSAKKFSPSPLFSVLVPVYNTPVEFLEPMVESVRNQTYQSWELCLADASDAAHAQTSERCRAYAHDDGRIRYRKLEVNGGIAANTNSCLELARGDYFALLDHDDVLHPSALYAVAQCLESEAADMVYSDEITFSKLPTDGYFPHFKPGFSPDTLRSYNYICHFLVFSRELQERTGLFDGDCDGSQDYDYILRLSEQARCVCHIPRILYYWRAHERSVAAGAEAKGYAVAAAKRALAAHLERVGLPGTVGDASLPTIYRINYELRARPLISIIIPNMDHREDLELCIRSIISKTDYENYELLVVENNSTEEETFAFYEELGSLARPPSIRVLSYEGSFNFSAINNWAARQARGEVLLFLNNDTEVISPAWLREMLMFAQRDDVAAVGARLLYPDETVQHAGVILGIGGAAGHAHKNFRRDEGGYVSRLQLAQNVSAVTGACLMLRANAFWEVGGFDEGFVVAFNDIDLCMRLRQKGYLTVYTPFAELYHHESKSRGLEDTEAKLKRFRGESLRFQKRWSRELETGDFYYNPNLTLEHEDFSLRLDPLVNTPTARVHRVR
ncbi:MAG: glycosyltransferase family 2 protein, partial [Coriobacteriales bacterium]|nr:glycosyltransferase family 2 protein [Coriobacteriales bacterium]